MQSITKFLQLDKLTYILILSILFGQLIKIPLGGTGGATVLDLAVIALILLGASQVKSKFKHIPPFFLMAFGFAVVALLSLIFTPLHLNLPEHLISLFYLIRFISLIALGLLIYLGVFKKFNTQIYSALLIPGLGLAILGILQLILFPDLSFLEQFGWDPHYFRTVSTFLDPNFTGAYLVLTLILLVENYLKFSSRLLAVLFLITFIALLTTFSRSAYLMFGASFLSLSLINRSLRLCALTIILLSVLTISFKFYTKYISEPRNIDRGQSANFRINSWQQGYTIFSLHPVLGVGFNSYRFALREYQLAPKEYLNSRSASSNDSSLLFVASTTGLFGLSVYILFILSLLYYSWKSFKKGNRWGAVMMSSLGGIVVNSFFVDSLFYPFILFWIILAASKLTYSRL